VSLSTLSLHRMSQEERSVFWEVIVSAILSKSCICTCVLFRTVSELELFHCTVHCTLYRRATHHVFTRVAKCIDVDGGIFENVLYSNASIIAVIVATKNTAIIESAIIGINNTCKMDDHCQGFFKSIN
jgi:hypothetical protein